MRDDFTEDTKRNLAARTNHTRSNPDCRASTSGPQSVSPKALNVGVAGNITAAAPGGPRYDPALTPEQRCHQDNGIWLCQNCGKLVDNDETKYHATLLRAWKAIAEDWALNSIGKTAQPPYETDEQRKLRAILPWKNKMIKLTQMTPARQRPNTNRTRTRLLVLSGIRVQRIRCDHRKNRQRGFQESRPAVPYRDRLRHNARMFGASGKLATQGPLVR